MTTFSIEQFLQTVNVMIKASDTNEDLSSADVKNRIRDAVQQYGAELPDVVTEDESGDGGIFYAISALASWSEGFSSILQIEYPAQTIASDNQPTFLEDDDFDSDYWDGATRYIRFINVTPAATETFRVRYTAPYVFANTPETVDIPGEHFYALCKKAACLSCRAIAAKYSRLGDSPVGAGSGAHVPKANEFKLRADDYCAEYRREVGLPAIDSASPNKAAGSYSNMDTAPEWPSGRAYVYHRNR